MIVVVLASIVVSLEKRGLSFERVSETRTRKRLAGWTRPFLRSATGWADILGSSGSG